MGEKINYCTQGYEGMSGGVVSMEINEKAFGSVHTVFEWRTDN